MIVTEFTTLLGWTPSEWAAVRQWAQRHGHELPGPIVCEDGYGPGWTVITAKSEQEHYLLAHRWKSAHGPDHRPSIGDEVMGFIT